MIGLLVAVAGMGGTGAAPPRPLRLEVESTAGAEVLRVVGESKAACRAQYALEVTSGGSGNRSVQRGSAELRPGESTTISTVRLAGESSRDVKALLSVQPCGATAYVESWSSGAKR